MLKSLLAFGVFGLIVFLALLYVGFFSKVIIVEKEVDSYYLVYENYVGPYQDTGEIQDELYYKLFDEAIETTKGFGIYYDNPKKVAKKDLRSDVGVILEGKNIERLHDLQKKGYNLKKTNEMNAVVTEFPYRGRMSVMAGVFRVYPKLSRYMTEKGYGEVPVMEIYDIPNKKIIYIAEISR